MDTSPTPTALMFACLTEAGTVAADTAVCARHVTGYDPHAGADDVTDWTLHDCTATEALVCTVCGADTEDLIYAVETGHNVRPTTTVTVRIPATVTLTVEVDNDGSRLLPARAPRGDHRCRRDDRRGARRDRRVGRPARRARPGGPRRHRTARAYRGRLRRHFPRPALV